MILQNCHATQIITEENGKSKWIVKNSDESVYQLPAHWDEKDVMTAIHFARYFERKAYEQGKKEVLELKDSQIQSLTMNYNRLINELRDQNIKLANIIEKHLNFEED